MCAVGESGKLVESGATTYGGRWVVDPTVGLISKGHPLGAIGRRSRDVDRTTEGRVGRKADARTVTALRA